MLEDGDVSELTKVLKPLGVDVAKILAAQAKEIEPKCRVCGCTEAKACPGGCSWTEKPDKKGLGLCSVCAKKTGNRSHARNPKGEKALADLAHTLHPKKEPAKPGKKKATAKAKK
jgi:hypothetical protein